MKARYKAETIRAKIEKLATEIRKTREEKTIPFGCSFIKRIQQEEDLRFLETVQEMLHKNVDE